MRFLAQLSGGVDSTASILKVLEYHPTANIDLLHVQFRQCQSMRWVPQLQASINIFRWLQKTYPAASFLFYSPAVYMPSVGKMKTQDVIFYQFFSGIVYGMTNIDIYDAIINGTTDSDCRNRNVMWPERGQLTSWPTEPTAYISHWVAGESILEALRNHNNGADTKVWRPCVSMQKEECYQSLPDEVKGYVWMCERPSINDNVFSSCMVCPACRELKIEIVQKIEQGVMAIKIGCDDYQKNIKDLTNDCYCF